jgi:hypothetical protein
MKPIINSDTMSISVVESNVVNWGSRSNDDKETAFSEIKRLYTEGDDTVKKDVLETLEGLSHKDINFKLILDDDTGALGLSEFDQIFAAGFSPNPQQAAIGLGLHKSQQKFRDSIRKYSGLAARGSVETWEDIDYGVIIKDTVSDGVYTIEDAGIKSLLLAVGFVIPTLINSIVFIPIHLGTDSFMTTEKANKMKDK